MSMTARLASALALAALALAAAPAARAAVTADTGNIEVFVGWYSPEEDVAGENLDDATYGMRGGFNFTRHFMMQIGAQMFSTDYPTIAGDVEIDQWMADVSFGWYANPDSRAVFLVYGGPGWSSTDMDFPVLKDDSDSSLSAHVGIAGVIGIGNRFYLRPDARYRWIDGDDGGDDRGDWEATLGFGWTLGEVSP